VLSVRKSHKTWSALLSVAALAGAGCQKEQANQPQRLGLIEAQPEGLRIGEIPSRVVEGSSPNSPAPFVPKPVPTEPPKEASLIRVGISREELLEILGRCSYRLTFVPPSKTRMFTEVFEPQPKDKDCVRHFGQQRYLIVGGVLSEILPGIDAPAEPAPSEQMAGVQGRGLR
jgi:hypothetical protein